MGINLGLESLASTKRVKFDAFDLYTDCMDIKDIRSETNNCFNELDVCVTGLTNLLTIREHLNKYGSTEVLVDLVGTTVSNENFITEGIKNGVNKLIELIKKFLAWIAKGLNKLAGVQPKVEVVEKVVEKIKEVPVEVIKEKEVIKTIEVAVEKPVYVEKDQKWKFEDDWQGRIEKLWSIADVIEAGAYTENGRIPDKVDAFIAKYKITANMAFNYIDEFDNPFRRKETILTTSQILPLVEKCGKISKASTRSLSSINKGIVHCQKWLEDMNKYEEDDEKAKERIEHIKEDIWKLQCVSNLAYRAGDTASHFCAYLTKEFMGGSRLYTDK